MKQVAGPTLLQHHEACRQCEKHDSAHVTCPCKAVSCSCCGALQEHVWGNSHYIGRGHWLQGVVQPGHAETGPAKGCCQSGHGPHHMISAKMLPEHRPPRRWHTSRGESNCSILGCDAMRLAAVVHTLLACTWSCRLQGHHLRVGGLSDSPQLCWEPCRHRLLSSACDCRRVAPGHGQRCPSTGLSMGQAPACSLAMCVRHALPMQLAAHRFERCKAAKARLRRSQRDCLTTGGAPVM